MISIIIPTFNEEGYIGECLRAVTSQDFEKKEIIISDSFSKDKTVEIAKEFDVTVVRGPRRGPGIARNLEANEAKGEILLFLDADTVLPVNALSMIEAEMTKKMFLEELFSSRRKTARSLAI